MIRKSVSLIRELREFSRKNIGFPERVAAEFDTGRKCKFAINEKTAGVSGFIALPNTFLAVWRTCLAFPLSQ
jgi:hypothetical protein